MKLELLKQMPRGDAVAEVQRLNLAADAELYVAIIRGETDSDVIPPKREKLRGGATKPEQKALFDAAFKAAEKKKGPGRGWWGPPRGSHGEPKKKGRRKPDHARGRRLSDDEYRARVKRKSLTDDEIDDLASMQTGEVRKKIGSAYDALEKNPWGMDAYGAENSQDWMLERQGKVRRDAMYEMAKDNPDSTPDQHAKRGDDAVARWTESDEAWGEVEMRLQSHLRTTTKLEAPHAVREALAQDHETIDAKGNVGAAWPTPDTKAIDLYGRPSGDRFTLDDYTVNEDKVSAKLSKATGIDKKVVGNVVERWNDTSNDNEYAAMHTQQMASELFGVKLSPWQKDKLDITLSRRLYDPATQNSLSDFETPSGDRWTIDASSRIGKYVDGVPYDSHNDATKAVLRAMYQDTQNTFAGAGYKPGETVTVFRGVGQSAADRGPGGRGDLGSVKSYRTNTLESWSLDRDTARSFATDNDGQVFSANVPIERILSTARTGFGKLQEWEVVVIAGDEPDEYRVASDILVTEADTETVWWGE